MEPFSLCALIRQWVCETHPCTCLYWSAVIVFHRLNEQQSHQLFYCQWAFGWYQSCSYHEQHCYEHSCATCCMCKQNLLGHVYFRVMYQILPNWLPSDRTNFRTHQPSGGDPGVCHLFPGTLSGLSPITWVWKESRHPHTCFHWLVILCLVTVIFPACEISV